jgi:hypothetical protein
MSAMGLACRTTAWFIPSILAGSVLLWSLPPASAASQRYAAEENGCLDCHLTLEPAYAVPAREWLTSIHADYEVGCSDCHGGDSLAVTKAGAKSEETGYIGQPPKEEIPQLCGSCHADSELMAPYGLPTNQLSEYYELSRHGQLLAEGDLAVATCYDCHGGHATLDAHSPTSAVYPTNLPLSCAKCHSDAALMEPYDIDTHQYELFRNSVHGVALLEDNNLHAPTCATCHGNHGAALPGAGELVDMCGLQCHPLTEDAYLSGAHGVGASGASDLPTCVDCHGRYDVQEADEQLLIGTEAGECGSCHPAESPEGEVASLLYEEISSAAGSIAEAVSMVDGPEQLQILLQAETRLQQARVLQHSAQLDLVKMRTEEARELSARAKAISPAPSSTTVAEWYLVLTIGGILGAIAIGLVLVWFARRG